MILREGARRQERLPPWFIDDVAGALTRAERQKDIAGTAGILDPS
jgi:hypothetical protein